MAFLWPVLYELIETMSMNLTVLLSMSINRLNSFCNEIQPKQNHYFCMNWFLKNMNFLNGGRYVVEEEMGVLLILLLSLVVSGLG